MPQKHPGSTSLQVSVGRWVVGGLSGFGQVDCGAGLTKGAGRRVALRPPLPILSIQPSTTIVTIEEFCLGLVPPQLQYCCARYDLARQLLSFAMDVQFTSSGAQGVVST